MGQVGSGTTKLIGSPGPQQDGRVVLSQQTDSGQAGAGRPEGRGAEVGSPAPRGRGGRGGACPHPGGWGRAFQRLRPPGAGQTPERRGRKATGFLGPGGRPRRGSVPAALLGLCVGSHVPWTHSFSCLGHACVCCLLFGQLSGHDKVRCLCGSPASAGAWCSVLLCCDSV